MQVPVVLRSMRRAVVLVTLIAAAMVAVSFFTPSQRAASQLFTLEQIKSYPFPNELTASASGEGSRGHSTSVANATFGSRRGRISKPGD